MAKTVVINASILDEKPTGLGVYTINMIKQLNGCNKGLKIFSPVDIEGINTTKISKYVKPSYGKKGGIARLLWTQLVLPFKIKKGEVLYHPFQYLSLLSMAKQIITIHDFIPMYYPQIAKHQYKYYKYFMPFLLKKAYKIVAISENTKRDLIKFYDIPEDKINVIYNGYDDKLFNPQNIKKEILNKYNIDFEYFFTVGATHAHKNIERVLEAFKNLNSNCKLVIAGRESKYMLSLKNAVKDMGIEGKVIFIGYVSDEDLPSLYYHSKAFVYPTLYEGFGLPILEAMACGACVICSNTSSLPEVYGDAALAFDPESSKDIREKLELFLNDKDIREELLIKSKENIKRFSWESTSKQLTELLE